MNSSIVESQAVDSLLEKSLYSSSVQPPQIPKIFRHKNGMFMGRQAGTRA